MCSVAPFVVSPHDRALALKALAYIHLGNMHKQSIIHNISSYMRVRIWLATKTAMLTFLQSYTLYTRIVYTVHVCSFKTKNKYYNNQILLNQLLLKSHIPLKCLPN